ncbi:transposase [Gammaproteobacteria bacterium]
MNFDQPIQPIQSILTTEQINDLRSDAKNMYGAERRSFQADITLKYCHGSARKAEKIFGWGRRTIKVGLAEKKTGVVCVGAQPAFCGSKIWEARYPKAAEELRKLIKTQQNLTSRLTSKEVLSKLSKQVPRESLPSLSTMDNILIRMGYRLRKVRKNSRKKKSDERSSLHYHQSITPRLKPEICESKSD